MSGPAMEMKIELKHDKSRARGVEEWIEDPRSCRIDDGGEGLEGD